MSKLRRFCTWLVAGATIFAAAGTAVANQESRFDEMIKRGKMIVGVSSEAPPFGFIDESGELVGFDIDIARLIAKSLYGDDSADRVEFVRQGFASRWPNVDSGKVDFGIQLTAIHPDRVAMVAFTRPYIQSQMVMVVRDSSPIQAIADVNDKKYSVAILTSPVQSERAETLFPEAGVTTYDSVASQFTALKTNRADAAQLDRPVALWYVNNNPDMRILPEPLSVPQNDSIFMKKGDFKLFHALDTYVAEMLGGSLYEEYAAIYEKWFGETPEFKR